jgi:hypothetical protein
VKEKAGALAKSSEVVEALTKGKKTLGMCYTACNRVTCKVARIRSLCQAKCPRLVISECLKAGE